MLRRQVTLAREVGQLKAALVIGDPSRLESIARHLGENGVPLPMPAHDVIQAVVRSLLKCPGYGRLACVQCLLTSAAM